MRVFPRVSDPALGALVAEGFLSRLSFGIVSLALPLYASSLGMPIAEIGALAAVPVLASLVVKPAAGWLADRYGLKRSFAGAIVLRSLVALLFIFAVTPLQLLAIRLLYGVSQGVRDPALNALLAERGGKKSIATAFAWYATAKNVAGNAGYAAGGFLLALLHNSFPTVFTVVFVLSMLPLAVVTVGVKEVGTSGPAAEASNAKPAERKPPGRRRETREARRAREGALVRELAFVREFGLTAAAERNLETPGGILPVGTWLYPASSRAADGAHSAAVPAPKPEAAEAPGKRIATGTIVSYVALGVMISGTAQMLKGLLPVIAKEYGHLSPAEIAAISLVSGAVALGAGPLFGWLSDNVSRRLVLSVRGITNTFSSALFVFFPSFVGFAIGDSVDEIGKAAFKPAWGALMAEVASLDRARRARMMGYLSIAEDIGEFLGPLAFSLLVSLWWFPAAFGVRVLLAAATELYASLLHRSREPEKPVRKLLPAGAASDRRG